MLIKTVRILKGSYRNVEVRNQVFDLVKKIVHGANGSFITVRPNAEVGQGWGDKIRIRVLPADVEYLDGDEVIPDTTEPVDVKTDEEIMERIGTRFDILHELTRATTSGDIRAMIVTGPPGIGKSYGILNELNKASLFNTLKSLKDEGPGYSLVKGSITGIGMYMTLFDNKDKNNVLVFDDCDVVFYDEVTLNLLKAALDTSKKRKISWTSASTFLEQKNIPDTFEFEGSIIFVTNIDFKNIRSPKLQDHLAALQSRCHYINLTIDTSRDKYLRIKQIYNTGELFSNYDITSEQGLEIMDWIDENKHRVRELSLRLAIKCIELLKVSPTRWQSIAEATLVG